MHERVIFLLELFTVQYNKIITEIQVEKKRLTPDWLIAQNVAKEAYVYINSLIDAIREGIDNSFRLGQYLYEKKMLFESCIISLRFYEYESKLSRLLEVIELKEREFLNTILIRHLFGMN